MTNKEAIKEIQRWIEGCPFENTKEAFSLATKALEKRPQAEWYDCIPNCLKARHGEYVVYKIDYLLDNLAREIYLLKGTRMKGGADRDEGDEI